MNWTLVAAVYGVMSLATLVLFGWDKRCAARGRWRVPERTLHFMELLGGWPGGMVGQSLFKHKRHKTAYLVVFYAIVILHAAGWAAWWYWKS